MIIEHNLHGIDIDPRCVQIAGLSLWLRAQKAWQRLGLRPAERPAIKRSNIVCAEPMPGEKDLLREFVEREFPAAERAVCLRLLEAIFDKMQLAGEAGSLLKIEEEIRTAIDEARDAWQKLATKPSELFTTAELNRISTAPQLTGLEETAASLITDHRSLTTDFWERLEERIYAALRDYAEQAENGGGFQRRLFAEDAARGFAFIDVCRKRYDVAVMNPPFGEASDRLLAYCDPRFPPWNRNVLCAFIQQQFSGLADGGFLASVMDRSLINKSTYEEFRQFVLLKDERLAVVLDLGWEVLDANVEVACCIARPKRVGKSVTNCFDVRDVPPDSKDVSLLTSVKGGDGSRRRVYTHPAASFAAFPNSAVVYDLPDSLLSTFFRFKNLKSLGLVSYTGHQLESNRHFMLFWEIPSGSGPSPDRLFCHLYNGGEYSRFCSLPQEVVRFGYFANLSPDDVTTYTFVLRNREKHFLQGVCFGVRGEFLDAHALPTGVLFTVEGQALPTPTPETALFLIGLLNSAPASRLLNTYCGQHKYSGYVNLLPCPPIDAPKSRELACSISELAATKRRAFAHTETSLTFADPIWASRKSSRLSEMAGRLFGELQDANRLLNEHVQKNDLLVCDLYELNDEESRSDILAYASTMPSDCVPGFQIDSTSALERQMTGDIISYSTGCAFGRWDIRYATGEQAAPELPDPFAPLPVCPPGQLQNAQGLPARPEDVPAAYPIRIPWDGILVDDPNHPLDLERRVREVMAVIWDGEEGGRRMADGRDADSALGPRPPAYRPPPTAYRPDAAAIEHEACEFLGVPTLREWFRRPAGFFADHLKRYSKSRRQAPIYWPLSTASGGYTLWMYYHRLTPDTLFRCLQQFVLPKLADLEKQVTHLRAVIESGEGSTKTRRQLEDVEQLRTELEEMRAELEHWAPRWKPNLNDGVIITACPLWKLFRLPKWRRDLEACWKSLEAGEYDWAHLAYTLWPDRVREKCKKDRSLAIAHGLEAICEVKPVEKKGRKAPKPDEPEDGDEEETAPELALGGTSSPRPSPPRGAGERGTEARGRANVDEPGTGDEAEPPASGLPRPRGGGEGRGEGPAAIDQTDRTEVLCVIRQVFNDGQARDRETAIREVALTLGYQRVGKRIREVLHLDLLTAVRRGILANEGGQLTLSVRDVRDATRDSLKEDFESAMGRGWIERDEAIRQFARWLGFARTGPVIEETARSLINGLIREDRLEADGDRIRRRAP